MAPGSHRRRRMRLHRPGRAPPVPSRRARFSSLPPSSSRARGRGRPLPSASRFRPLPRWRSCCPTTPDSTPSTSARLQGPHAPLVEAAVAAGKHVLVEKPLCHSPGEARGMVEAVARHGVHVMVGYMRRFDDIVLEAKRLLDSGSIGRLRSIATVFKLALPAAFHRVVDLDPEAAPSSDSDRPVARRPNDLLPDDEIMEQSVHHLNLVRFLGGEVREVAGAHLEAGNSARADGSRERGGGEPLPHGERRTRRRAPSLRRGGHDSGEARLAALPPTGSRSSPGSPVPTGKRSAGSFPSPIPTSRSSRPSPSSSARGLPTRAPRRTRSATSSSSPASTRRPPADRRPRPRRLPPAGGSVGAARAMKVRRTW